MDFSDPLDHRILVKVGQIAGLVFFINLFPDKCTEHRPHTLDFFGEGGFIAVVGIHLFHGVSIKIHQEDFFEQAVQIPEIGVQLILPGTGTVLGNVLEFHLDQQMLVHFTDHLDPDGDIVPFVNIEKGFRTVFLSGNLDEGPQGADAFILFRLIHIGFDILDGVSQFFRLFLINFVPEKQTKEYLFRPYRRALWNGRSGG